MPEGLIDCYGTGNTGPFSSHVEWGSGTALLLSPNPHPFLSEGEPLNPNARARLSTVLFAFVFSNWKNNHVNIWFFD